ncbi:hypothetical protein LEP1GSC020_2228 [Leptospira interrogans serovar Grippotyphosa str. 2006006986]|nr:hypothetical protein LEP1GSC020_2228 [Leptospira interrogans serovar Grippotyphosa str. 2006006986]
MDRRSGLKKAHFSSVPTRMSLFTCKKYVFLIEKNFPNFTALTGKLNTTLFMNRVEKLSTTLFMNRVEKLSTTLFMNRVEKLNTTLFMNRVEKLNTTLFMNRVEKLSTTLFMNRVEKLSTTLFMNRVVGWELSFTEDLSELRQIYIEIKTRSEKNKYHYKVSNELKYKQS